MTDFIYRTVSHTGSSSTAPRAAADLVYRGVAHDGLGTDRPTASRPVQMVYRGVYFIADAVPAQAGPAADATAEITVTPALAA